MGSFYYCFRCSAQRRFRSTRPGTFVQPGSPFTPKVAFQMEPLNTTSRDFIVPKACQEFIASIELRMVRSGSTSNARRQGARPVLSVTRHASRRLIELREHKSRQIIRVEGVRRLYISSLKAGEPRSPPIETCLVRSGSFGEP